MFHTMDHHTQHINWGDLVVRGQTLLGGLAWRQSVGGEQWVRVVNSNDIGVWGFFFTLYLLPFIIVFYFILLLNSCYLNPCILPFSDSFPSHKVRTGVRKRLVVLSCWLGLNHNRIYLLQCWIDKLDFD